MIHACATNYRSMQGGLRKARTDRDEDLSYDMAFTGLAPCQRDGWDYTGREGESPVCG